MSDDLVIYPTQWRTLEYPHWRSDLLWMLEDLAHDPTTCLNWSPVVTPPETLDYVVWSALDSILNDWSVLDISPPELLGERLLDDAEVRALERLVSALLNFIGPPQPFDFGRAPPLDHMPQTADEAYGHPGWSELAHAAQALYDLVARWGVPTFSATALAQHQAEQDRKGEVTASGTPRGWTALKRLIGQ